MATKTEETTDKKLKAKKTDGKGCEVNNGGVSKTQIDAWKKEHGTVKSITLITAKEEITGKPTAKSVCYLSDPIDSRTAISMALGLHQDKKPMEAGNVILNNCWLGGDPAMKTNAKLNNSAAILAGKMVEFLEGELGNC